MALPKIDVGVIPAAGKGDRIAGLPLTRILPKTLLPILNFPLIDYSMRTLLKLGAKTAFVVVNERHGKLIQDYCRSGEDFGIEVEYLSQKNPTGIADAVELAEPYISDSFAVVLGDDLTLHDDWKPVVDEFFKTGAVALQEAVGEPNADIIRRTCCLELDADMAILNIWEKPAHPPTQLRGIGVYLFGKESFSKFRSTPRTPERNQREISTTLRLLSQERKAYAAVIEGRNFNINSVSDLMDATRNLLNASNPK